jgi:hypothetical protein
MMLHKIRTFAVVSLILLWFGGGCSNPPAGPSSPETSPVSAGGLNQHLSNRYDVHAGDAFLAALNPAFSPVIAEASNGDTVEVMFTGVIDPNTKAASGSGTFTHKNAAGTILGGGMLTATELLSFQFYGHSTATPPTFTAGKALIRVVVDPAGPGPTFGGTLWVTCHLPGVQVPQGTEEGIRLNIQDVINFNDEAGGGTVFVEQP